MMVLCKGMDGGPDDDDDDKVDERHGRPSSHKEVVHHSYFLGNDEQRAGRSTEYWSAGRTGHGRR